jgi:hypothetical protein
MKLQLKFGHKILLMAATVTILVFSLFALYNDYRQTRSTRADLHNTLQNLSGVLAANINSWLSARTLLIESSFKI